MASMELEQDAYKAAWLAARRQVTDVEEHVAERQVERDVLARALQEDKANTAALLAEAKKTRASARELQRAVRKLTAQMQVTRDRCESAELRALSLVRAVQEAQTAAMEEKGRAEASMAEMEAFLREDERYIQELTALLDNHSAGAGAGTGADAAGGGAAGGGTGGSADGVMHAGGSMGGEGMAVEAGECEMGHEVHGGTAVEGGEGEMARGAAVGEEAQGEGEMALECNGNIDEAAEGDEGEMACEDVEAVVDGQVQGCVEGVVHVEGVAENEGDGMAAEACGGGEQA